jgi:hypothetical protein
MGEVTAHASPLRKRIEGRLGRVRMRVTEANVIVHEIAVGLDQRPTLKELALADLPRTLETQ